MPAHFWRAAGLGLVSEIGDGSFFTVLIFAVWCPIQGMRSGPSANLERCLVASAAVSALLIRSLVTQLESIPGGCMGPFLASAGFAALAVRAFLLMRRSDNARALRPPQAVARDQSAEDPPAPAARTGGFLGNFKAYTPPSPPSPAEAEPIASGVSVSTSGYGTTATALGVLSEKGDYFNILACLAAFVVPFLLIFLASSGASGRGDGPVRTNGVVASFAASAGCFFGTLLAAAVGFVLEREASEHKLLFGALCGLLALSIGSLREGALSYLAVPAAQALIQAGSVHHLASSFVQQRSKLVPIPSVP